MKISEGDVVTVVLQNPREKILGTLKEISSAGLFVRGIDLAYFDEWAVAIRNGEQYLPMQDIFYPMWRVERMTRDAESAGVPSLAEQFQQKTGKELTEF
ncbi:MAG: hypothetical protein DWQ47_15980 [Acidobacteria bacterium]|nr:MAG: hypothetical protein DWQ32_03380 [Acidobacteriota bacterium]REK02446.1 MAG: hypothetical protein DWQ38_08755 [Acidobacteriota bacterium]REK13752.1 MAG: hypothetical protein DWQ43_09070 [Acidobacteriota bacterium]REK41746.1 MAG: hypothetical protein DWQ47_15980 [Acidobacteriota bacterium]